MKSIAFFITILFYQNTFAQSTDNKFKDINPLKELGANLIWMTLEPTSVLQHSSVDIFFPTLGELKLASKDTTVSENIRKIFAKVSNSELTYLIPYSALLFNIQKAGETIFLVSNKSMEASSNHKILDKLFENLKSNNYTFKITTDNEKNYIQENSISHKVISCEITIPALDGKSVKFDYFCYKYGSVYKVGLPGKKINWSFIYAQYF